MSEAAQHSVEMRCRKCGYDLRALTSNRCPECRRGFDRNDPGSVLTEPVNARPLLVLAIVGITLVGVPFVVIGLAPLGSMLILLGGAIGGGVASRCFQIMYCRLPWIRHRWALLPAFILGGAAFAFIGLGMIGILIALLLS